MKVEVTKNVTRYSKGSLKSQCYMWVHQDIRVDATGDYIEKPEIPHEQPGVHGWLEKNKNKSRPAVHRKQTFKHRLFK